MAQPVATPGKPVTTKGFEFEWADASSPVLRQARPAEVIFERFAQGARCLVAANEEGELAGWLWFVVGRYVEDEVRVVFVLADARSAWDFDVSVMPRYRMGRLFAALWQRAHAELHALGIRQTISRISAFNAGSLASHRRLGARTLGAALFLCIGPVQLMKSSIAPKWHLSWREGQRPTLRIDA